MSKPDDIPQDVWDAATTLEMDIAVNHGRSFPAGLIARAILAERERWKPAVTYFERYCQDEADSIDNCVCGQEQHEDAKAFLNAVRGGSNA